MAGPLWQQKFAEWNHSKWIEYKEVICFIETDVMNAGSKFDSVPRATKTWSILDTPKGSYFGPSTIKNRPNVQFKRNLKDNPEFYKKYFVSFVQF